MTKSVGLFDTYNRQARLYPSLLVLLPSLVALLAWFPSLLTGSIGHTLLTLAVSCGLLFVLSVFSRTCGKRAEARLLRVWGEWPTTQWLRHTDGHLPAATKQRYHAALKRKVPKLKLPTGAEERADPTKADEQYRSAVDWLKEHSRGNKFPLVLKENIEYGFRRNMRGIRPFAIGATAITFMISGFGIVYLVSKSTSPWLYAVANQVPASILGATVLLLVALLAWTILVTDSWVREAGDQYARALLAVCDAL